MVHYLSYWPTDYPYDTLLSSTGPLKISMAQYLSFGPLAIPLLHCYLLLDHWLFLWYTAIFYWPTGYFYGTLPFYYWSTGYPYVTLLSSTGPLDMVHYPLLLAHWLSLWFTFLSYWPTGDLYDTLLSSTGPMAISIVHCPLLLAHWVSLGYTKLSY